MIEQLTIQLRQKLITQTGVFGAFITNENIITQVVFSNSIDDIINDSLFDSIGNDIGNNLNEIISGGRHNDDSLPLAKYTVIYSYQPIFSLSPLFLPILYYDVR